MQAISRRHRWLLVAAVASIALDAIAIVGFAASIAWICFAAWLGMCRAFERPLDKFALAVALAVPLLTSAADYLIEAQVDRDMQGLSQSQDWKGARRLDDLKGDHLSRLTRVRLLWLKPDSSGAKIEARAFPYTIVQYDLNTGEKRKRLFD